MMREPRRIKLDPETPLNKDVNRIPMPPVYKPEWDISRNNNDDVYSSVDLKNINKNLDTITNEDSDQDNPQSL